MTDDVEHGAVEPVDEATVAAIEEIRAAMSAATLPENGPASAGPPDPPAAAASGSAVGHGTIRLRGLLPRPTEADATTHGQTDPAVAAGPIGHGTIRLLGADPLDQHVESEPAPAQPEPQPPLDPFDAAAAAAREEILLALTATS